MSALGNKRIMAQNIKYYMDSIGIDRREFCNRLGFAYSTVTDWLNAEKYPRIDKIELMARFFGISKADLVEPRTTSAVINAGYDNNTSVSDLPVRIPVLGRVAGGNPLFINQEQIGEQWLSAAMAKRGTHFGLKIAGQSMAPRICDGDIVIVRKQDYIEDGQIGIIAIGNADATCKMVRQSKDGIVLVGLNVDVYQPHFYSRQDVEALPIAVIGLVVEIRHVLE